MSKSVNTNKQLKEIGFLCKDGDDIFEFKTTVPEGASMTECAKVSNKMRKAFTCATSMCKSVRKMVESKGKQDEYSIEMDYKVYLTQEKLTEAEEGYFLLMFESLLRNVYDVKLFGFPLNDKGDVECDDILSMVLVKKN
jgi:hypothetical protein